MPEEKKAASVQKKQKSEGWGFVDILGSIGALVIAIIAGSIYYEQYIPATLPAHFTPEQFDAERVSYLARKAAADAKEVTKLTKQAIEVIDKEVYPTKLDDDPIKVTVALHTGEKQIAEKVESEIRALLTKRSFEDVSTELREADRWGHRYYSMEVVFSF